MQGSIIPTTVNAAKGLRVSGTTVTVSSAAPPSAGQVLTALTSTTANWQTPSAGGGGSSFASGINVTGNAIFNSGVQFHINTVTGTPYTGTQNDYIIAAAFPSGTSGVIVLPSTLNNGTFFIIKDDVGSGLSYNITISGSPNIDGSGNFIINSDYESINVYKSTNGWRIV